jgi:hypothetical protein
MSSVRRLAAVIAAAGTAVAGTAALALAPSAPALAGPRPAPFLHRLRSIATIASTVPASGDVNPYGVVVIGRSQGRLRAGDILVSNFNNKANQQGTGQTIVEISPHGRRTLFAAVSPARLPGPCPGGVGLTTALAVLPGGWVVVGSTPSANGMAATARAGCLIVLDSRGRVRETIAGHGINGPWDATAVSSGRLTSLFVTNVLNGTVAARGRVVHQGTVLRLTLAGYRAVPPRLVAVATVGSGFAEQASAAAFVLGPTGVGLSRGGTLYVADTRSNRVTAIPAALTGRGSAGTGRVLTAGGALAAPLGLALAPDGDVLTVNGGNGRIVETTPAGAQVATRLLDASGTPPGNGALFGLTLAPGARGIYYVDDAVNTLRLLR